MAGKPSKPMTPFDKSVTPSCLYKLKLFLSFLPPSSQRFLAIYIKFYEFRYTMDFFRGLPFHTFSMHAVEELMPYMDESEQAFISQMSSILEMMELFHTMSDGTGSSGDSTFSTPADLMRSMMSGEDAASFQSYMNIFDQKLSSASPDSKKGDSDDE